MAGRSSNCMIRVGFLCALGSVMTLHAADTPLADAVERQDPVAVNLIADGAGIDAAQPDGMTALLWAAYHDQTDLAKKLLSAKATPDHANRYGVTALLLACQNGSVALTEALLVAGANPSLPGAGGETPLHAAARTGVPAVVKALLAAGAKTEAALPSGQTPLMWAASEGNTEALEILLDSGAKLDAQLASGLNAWLFAVRAGHVETVRALLQHGADINYATTQAKASVRKQPAVGTSALIVAIENGHFELAAELVDRGADPNDLRTGYGPLHVLTWVRKPDIGENNGDPPPDGSGRMSSEDLVRHLVAKGAKVDLKLTSGPAGKGKFARPGCTPLLLAADRADYKYVKLLVELGADPKACNVEGGTSLMTAAGLGAGPDQDEAGTEDEAFETVTYLLGLGLDPNAVTTGGETAMHGAAYASFAKMVKLLDAHGAKIEIWNRPNDSGFTPLRLAEGHRLGNFKPSFETVAAIKAVMAAHGAAIPPPMPPAEIKNY